MIDQYVTKENFKSILAKHNKVIVKYVNKNEKRLKRSNLIFGCTSCFLFLFLIILVVFK